MKYYKLIKQTRCNSWKEENGTPMKIGRIISSEEIINDKPMSYWIKGQEEFWEELENDFILSEKWCVKNTDYCLLNLIDTIPLFETIYNGSANNKYYFVNNKGDIDHEFNIPNGYTEITLEQFKEHVLKQKTMDRKIISYKLIKTYPDSRELGFITKQCHGSINYSDFPEFWEPVYEEEFKVGDWVFVKNGGSGAYGANNFVGQICNKQEALKVNYHGEDQDQISEIYLKNQNTSWGLCKSYEIRKATPEEIEQATTTKIGDYKANFIGKSVEFNGVVYAKTELQKLKSIMNKGQIKSLNVGCSGQYEVDLELLNKIISKF
jgi:hypothetical protein